MKSVTMTHPKAKEPIEVNPGKVTTMESRGWKVKTATKPKKQEIENGDA